ncbi:MAG: hypothetical protein K2R98_22080 [Gemmataceae bacterium]|nr:hypothetical protein [Gemmataceae bacterium]
MDCPQPVVAIVLTILQWGILRARAAGWAGDSDRSALESDHIHNLPNLLIHYHEGELVSYFKAAVPSFIAECQRRHISFEMHEDLWQSLRQQLSPEAENY